LFHDSQQFNISPARSEQTHRTPCIHTPLNKEVDISIGSFYFL
jgi:hypothetical protein